MGFSAGGTVTLSVAFNSTDENRPDFIAAIYPWVGELGDKVPEEKTPAFIVVANDDNLNRITSYNVCYTKLLRYPVITGLL